MKKLVRIDQELNGFRLSFGHSLLDEIRDSYGKLSKYLDAEENQVLFAGGASHCRIIRQADFHYQLVSYGEYPLLWLSSHDASTFQIYQRFFDALAIDDEIKSLVDHDASIVMYCGFLVIGDRAPSPLWHVDYEFGANGFTLITPLFDLAPDHGHLLFEAADGKTCRYEYQTGEAIIFGDGFMHSTEAYDTASRKRVLVSLTFGTDKTEYWNILKNTVGGQSDYLVLPCGHVHGTCNCVD